MDVKVVNEQGEALLIEWRSSADELKRSIVPRRDVTDIQDGWGKCSSPERGIPYGLDFSALAQLAVTPKILDQALKNAGIWTAEDLRLRPNEARGAFYSIIAPDLARLLAAAQAIESQQHL